MCACRYDYDPTKWLIAGFAAVGLTHDLQQFDGNAIRLGELNMARKKLAALEATLSMPPESAELPLWTHAEFLARCAGTAVDMSAGSDGSSCYEKRSLIVIDGIAHDVTTFITQHPGGAAFLRSSVGKDGSDKFNGKTGIYKHSNAARNVLAQFRKARVTPPESTAAAATVAQATTAAMEIATAAAAYASASVMPQQIEA